MVVGIIPARYGSVRYVGKPLAAITMGGRTQPMVQWVYEQATKADSLHHVVVATDDQRIYDVVKNFGGTVIMTKIDHANGTSRCAEAVELITELYHARPDIVVNIQGDEPQILPEQINDLVNVFAAHPAAQIATLIKPINDTDELMHINCVKAVVAADGKALYFSRAALPHQRDISPAEPQKWLQNHVYYKHLGVYAYTSDALRDIAKLPPTPHETAENLEQLRWIEHGYAIYTATTHHQSIAIDTPEDLNKLHAQMGV